MLDLAGHRRRKQGCDSPRLQVSDNEQLTEITYKKRDKMSTVFPCYPLGFTQIHLDLFAGDKRLDEVASYFCLESKTFQQINRYASMLRRWVLNPGCGSCSFCLAAHSDVLLFDQFAKSWICPVPRFRAIWTSSTRGIWLKCKFGDVCDVTALPRASKLWRVAHWRPVSQSVGRPCGLFRSRDSVFPQPWPSA